VKCARFRRKWVCKNKHKIEKRKEQKRRKTTSLPLKFSAAANLEVFNLMQRLKPPAKTFSKGRGGGKKRDHIKERKKKLDEETQ
jgi:hypothetical protein